MRCVGVRVWVCVWVVFVIVAVGPVSTVRMLFGRIDDLMSINESSELRSCSQLSTVQSRVRTYVRHGYDTIIRAALRKH